MADVESLSRAYAAAVRSQGEAEAAYGKAQTARGDASQALVESGGEGGRAFAAAYREEQQRYDELEAADVVRDAAHEALLAACEVPTEPEVTP